jgi:AraC-like DNA-binding protein
MRPRGPSYSVHPPPPPLAGRVDYFWSLTDAPSHSRERVIPSGTIEIVFNLDEDEFQIHRPRGGGEECARFRGAIVSGAYRRAFGVETRAHASIVGVHFKPGGAASVLGVPAGELADAHVELEALWGRRAVELRERLCAAADPAQRFRILEQALTGTRSPSPDMRGEVAFALGRLGAPGVAVGDVARHVQLSHRRFIELFTERVGMTPKRYSRVRRFQRGLDLVKGGRAPEWSQVALDCGYFDQAHLCRDWVEFTGLSPAEFLRLRSVPVKENHVALPEPTTSNSSNTPSRSAR